MHRGNARAGELWIGSHSGIRRTRSVYRPGGAAAEEAGQVAFALLVAGFVQLAGHELVVAGAFDFAEHADGGGGGVVVVEAGQRERVRGVGAAGIVGDQVGRVGGGGVGGFDGAVGAG